MESWAGDVAPSELLCWERQADLSEGGRRDLRNTIVKRSRVRANRLWCLPTGVRLAEGWQNSLSPMDRKLIEGLSIPRDKPFETWTLREVKEALRLPLESTLGILARVEALYWVPPVRPTRLRVLPAVDQGSPVVVTPELRALASEVIALPWVVTVTRNDLRFGYPSELPLTDWIAEQLVAGHAHAMVPHLLSRLAHADRLTAAEEAREIAFSAARVCAPQRATDDVLDRWSSMLIRRYISPTGDGRTLVEIGEEYGVTRERIRQVCESFEDILPECSVVTPCLDRALRAAARVVPMQVDDLNEQVRPFIGEDAGIEALVGWAEMLGREATPVQCRRARVRARSEIIEVTMVQAPDAPPWFEAAIRHVTRDCGLVGCTSVLRIAGRLALREGLVPGQESLESALESSAGFRWLDKENGWFTLGDTSSCAVANRVRKIMHVAEESIGTDEIAGALASDDMWLYRGTTTPGVATPPVHVLRELFLGWPWLKVVQQGRFVAGPGFDCDGVLSEAEEAMVKLISARNGVACRFELKDVVMNQLGLTDVFLAALLGSSPIVTRLEHGLYSLRGRKIGDGALAEARQRLRARTGFSAVDVESRQFLVRVTPAALLHEQHYVPTVFQEQLVGKQHAVKSAEGIHLGQARVGHAGALRGINQLFPSAQAGDHFRVEIEDDGLRVTHLPSSGAGDEEAEPLGDDAMGVSGLG